MNLANIRQDFPILQQIVNDEGLIYFDNAATSQTPEPVVQAMVDYYHQDNANVHRGVHSLAQRATDHFEGGRAKIAKFIGAHDAKEIAFTSGTTASINMIARSLIEPLLEAGDYLLTTRLEHHSNLVPWQAVCQRTGAQLEFLPLDAHYQVDFAQLDTFVQGKKVKAICIQHVSNVLGIEQPLKELIEWAHERNILVTADGAQAAPHQKINVSDLAVDAYAFSSHKMYGPTGLGVTYIASHLLDQAQPVFFGGEMIHYVGDYESNYKEAPWKFEAGTQPIAQIVGLTKAIDWIEGIGFDTIQAQEAELSTRLWQGLTQMEGVQVYTPEKFKDKGIVSFNIEGIHPHDSATAFDQLGIAVRAGHHCAQPLMRLLDTPATLRASVMVYNSMEEVETFLKATQEVKEFFNYGA